MKSGLSLILTFLALALSSSLVLGLTAKPILYFPQIADGGGSQFQILLTNPGLLDEKLTVLLKDGNGDPLSIDLNGSKTSQLEFSIPPGGTRRIASEGKGSLKVGYAVVYSETSGSEVTGSISYTLLGNQLSVAASRVGREFHTVVQVEKGSNTGFALANSRTQSIVVDAVLLDTGGQIVAETQINLLPNQQQPQFVTELFAGTDLTSFLGSLHLHSNYPFAGVALGQASDASLTALSGATSAYTGNLVGSELVFLLDSGIDLSRADLDPDDLESNSVHQLTGFSRSRFVNVVSIFNSNPDQAVTLQIDYYNDQCERIMSFLKILLCGESFTFDPLSYETTGLSVLNHIFGKVLSIIPPISAAEFGSGVFTVIVRPVARNTDVDKSADLLFPSAPGADLVGECNITEQNVGSGGLEDNLTAQNATPVSFDFLTVSNAGELYYHDDERATCEAGMFPGDARVDHVGGAAYRILP